MTATNDPPEHYRNRYLCPPWWQIDHDADARVLGLDFRPLGDAVVHSTFDIEGRDGRGGHYVLGAAQGVEMTHEGRADGKKGPLQVWLQIRGDDVMSMDTGGARVFARQLLAVAGPRRPQRPDDALALLLLRGSKIRRWCASESSSSALAISTSASRAGILCVFRTMTSGTVTGNARILLAGWPTSDNLGHTWKTYPAPRPVEAGTASMPTRPVQSLGGLLRS